MCGGNFRRVEGRIDRGSSETRSVSTSLFGFTVVIYLCTSVVSMVKFSGLMGQQWPCYGNEEKCTYYFQLSNST